MIMRGENESGETRKWNEGVNVDELSDSTIIALKCIYTFG